MLKTIARFGRWPVARPAVRARGGLAVVVLASLFFSGLWLLEPLALQGVRLAQFDQFQRWQPRVYTPAAVRVVDIDEASLHALGQWPWPRTRVAELIGRLHAAGARVVALDILLTEPDRTAPRALAQQWQDAQVHAALARLPDPDQALAAQLALSPVVLGSSLLHQAGIAHAPPELPYRLVFKGAPPEASALGAFSGALWPLPALQAQAQGLGALNAAPDADGVLRRVPLLLRQGSTWVPSLSAETLRVAQGARNYVVGSNGTAMQELRIGTILVPTSPAAELWLHYTAEQPQRLIPAHAVLDGTAPPELLRGHLVLVGSSATGLMDLRATPSGARMPGVLAHAQALEQMLLGQFLQRPSWAAGLEWLVLTLGCLGLGTLALRVSARRGALALVAALLALGAGGWSAFVAQAWLIDVANPALAMLLTFGLASGYRHSAVERQQRWLRTAFARYVSPNRVAHLVAHPEQLHLGGQRQVCSFVFTDLAGFTPMLEGSDPARVVALLNAYLEGMLQIVFRHEGTLDRFVGDALAVLFSAPVPQPDHRTRALSCALEMDRFAQAFAHAQRSAGVPWGHTRIGVHCGEVLVGNFGGQTLFDYRALGDPINTAARLEGANKYLGTRVCVSDDVLQGCPGVAAREAGLLVLKGKSRPLRVWIPLATLDGATCAPAADYDAALATLHPGATHDPLRARSAFAELAARYPLDALVALHAQRLQQGEADACIVLAQK